MELEINMILMKVNKTVIGINYLLKDKILVKKAKFRLNEVTVRSTVVYGEETWTLNKKFSAIIWR